MQSAKERLQSKGEANGVGARAVAPVWERPLRGQLKQTLDKFSGKAETNEEHHVQPRKGSLAGESVSQEVVQLCRVMNENGRKTANGTTEITFGELSNVYAKITNKLVGILIRARKQGFVKFEGEVLFEGKDQDVMITLIKSA